MSAAPQLTSSLKLKIEIYKGPLAGQGFSFEKETIKIGRGADNDLVLANDGRASRHHAEIQWQDDGPRIFNVSQKNFLAVNGTQTDGTSLSPGDFIVIGDSEFKVDFQVHTQNESRAIAQQATKLHAASSPVPVQAQPPAPTSARQPLTSVPPPIPSAILQPSMPGGPAVPSHISPTSSRSRSSSAARPRVHVESSSSGPKIRFFIVLLLVVGAGVWLFTSNHAKKNGLTIRSSEQVEKDLEASREEMKEFETRKEKINTIQYRRAQENFIRGFRDYKQGNFARAREAFQVVLNLDPDNPLALRYYNLSKVKFDEMVKFHMLQGNRYREKKNWHLCKASYFNVMTMLNNPQDPVFKEAKQYFDQCSIALEGNY